jgi:Rod binding domain-containing protein
MEIRSKIDPTLALAQTQLDVSAKGQRQQPPGKTAEQFEAFFIFTILKEFGKTMQQTGKSYAEQTHMSLLYEKVADFLAKKGIGIKEVLAKYAERG